MTDVLNRIPSVNHASYQATLDPEDDFDSKYLKHARSRSLREASIYTGITMAEYYRDMGYDVALMARLNFEMG